MNRAWFPAVLGLVCLAVDARAQAKSVEWIWFNEGDPAKVAPAEARYFRRAFGMERPVDEASLDIAADKSFQVWVNGVAVGEGDNPKRVYRFDIKKHLAPGKNVIAIQAKGSGGPAGLLARAGYVPNGQSRVALVSDGSWKAAKTKAEGWLKADFDDSKWPAVKVIGAYGKAGPWRDLVWDAGGDERFSVPPGFRVENVIKENYSLVNLTFDAKGRLLVSREGGPILLCTEPDGNGVFQSIKPYTEQVKNCQGMCWVDDALLLVGQGSQGTGLYRVRVPEGAGAKTEVKLLHRFVGNMTEHGPHAILHGPDNWLYLVIGNHAWAKPSKLADNSPLRRWSNGQMGPDQGKQGSTEDVLLPRLNDSRGHAANILAPGGTIWRLDREGQNMSLVSTGFRNHFDAAFNSAGELFTFDSDMEWDEALPWYRPVRICHCPPGADFVWRTGAANTPDYYIDSLPPMLETGRGSPVGVEYYDHYAFPEKYRGCFFMGDWSLGVIYAVFTERAGASYKVKAERFCQGVPMNVTDLAVGPDGALYFCMGGRGSQGGVYRIVNDRVKKSDINWENPTAGLMGMLDQPQILSAWSRAGLRRNWDASPAMAKGKKIDLVVGDGEGTPVQGRINLLTIRQNNEPKLNLLVLTKAAGDKEATLRAHAVWLLGVNGSKEGEEALIKALKDEDALVRRRACEALIRAGFEPPVSSLWPLLADKDRFVRTAARLVLQRIDPKDWTDRIWKEEKDQIACEGIVALCKTNQAEPYAEPIFKRLGKLPAGEASAQLDWLRTMQLALMHAGSEGDAVKACAGRCLDLFPQKEQRVNRELAILLTHFRRSAVLDKPIHALLLKELLASKEDRQQQIHYFYCLRLLHAGWNAEQRDRLLSWYDSTLSWTGGHSFTPFLENMLRDLKPAFADDLPRIVRQAERYPGGAAVLLRNATAKELPEPAVLGELYDKLSKAKPTPGSNELKAFIVEALGKSGQPDAQAALRKIADREPALREPVARALARTPAAENWPYLVNGLQSSNKLVLFEVIEALKKIPTRPKAEDPAPYRQLLLASGRLEKKNRWQAVQLLRHWGNKSFGAEDEADVELAAWTKWFAQTFPKEPPLPNSAADKPGESKYQVAELVAFLDKEGKKADSTRGRLVFEKGQCMKCHKFGKEGEAIGPDLTNLSKRFQRVDVLNKLAQPSKTISDQYRGAVILTKNGAQITGLAAPQGDTVTVLQSDGTKVTLKKDEIDQQIASLVSVMPEKLLDPLTKEEIADLLAFLESEPK